MRRIRAVLPFLLIASQGVAQQQEDWRLPFRNPTEKLEPPAITFQHLRRMYEVARKNQDLRGYDEDGIEVCDHPEWRKSFEALGRDERFDLGWLSQVIRLSSNAPDRQIALYGMFYSADKKTVMQMLNHIPGEPLIELRQEAYPRAMAFLRAELPKKNAGDLEEWSKLRVGPAGTLPPKPGEFTYSFDAVPYFALLGIDNPIDQRQALWFLGEVVRMRPELAREYFGAALPYLNVLLLDDDMKVRESARDFIVIVDPTGSVPPSLDDDVEVIRAWLQGIIDVVFPPIRPISSGLVELYRSPQLDAIVEKGLALLEDGSLGDTASGQTKPSGRLGASTYYRGLRIARMPEPLDQLEFEVDWVITAVNGQPVATCAELLDVLKREIRKRAFLVEYVDDGRMQAKEYRRKN